MRSLLLVLSLSLSAGAAAAQDVPDGSWSRSCREGVMHQDGSFAAMCPQRNGVWVYSQIDISDCRYVENRNGRLVCGGNDDDKADLRDRRIATLR